MTIEEIAKQEGCNCYKYLCELDGYKVYEIWVKEFEGAIIGFPQFVLEKDNVFTRVDDVDETLKIMHHVHPGSDDDE